MSLKKPAVQSVQELGISYKLKVSYFVVSIIPIVVMTYLYVSYVMPALEKEGQSDISLVVAGMLVMTIFLSVLGLVLITRAARESINSLAKLNGRMDSLLDLTRGFREGVYVDVLMDTIANSAAQILDAEACAILLHDDSGALRFEYLTDGKASLLKGKAVGPGEGMIGRAAMEGRPVIMNAKAEAPRHKPRPGDATFLNAHSFVSVPLLIEGRKTGAIVVLNKQGDEPFSEHDQKILFSLADHAAVSIQRARGLEASHSDFIQITEILMSAMDHHIPELRGHARRVASYALRLAKEMGLNEEDQKGVYLGAMLHDIGLLKYSQDDYWGMKKFDLHPKLGYDMIKAVSVWRGVAPAVYSHHERFDGTGYPRGIAGQDIPLEARIIAVAEVFDAMVSSRSYKAPLGFDAAVTELKLNSGTQFDPAVVEAFARGFKKEDVMQ